MSAAQHPIDWQEAYALLERSRRALDADEELTPEESRRLLERRAEALAQPRDEGSTDAELLELLVLSLASERYGVFVEQVIEVVSLATLTNLPCTPGFVLGIANHRGRILTVLDIRQLLRGTSEAHAESRSHLLVVIDAGAGAFGILAEATEIVRVAVAEVTPLSPTLGSGRSALVRGVTEGLITVLDMEELVGDPRFAVEDESG